MRILGLVGATVIGGLVAACSGEYAVGSATVTAASNVSATQALDKITTERCNRELSCGNIGPDRYWDTMQACRRDVHQTTRDYLQAESCDTVDTLGLATCADAIRNSQCGDERAGVPILSACRTARLCR
ncbi:MAG TPA: DUF6184 family natural product biosynthesis lipoprotein [Polyangiaceae bacterium]|jgi:hypothetical protein